MVDSMSERYAKACAGKHHYRSERRAREAAKDSQRIYGVKQNAYPCPFHPRMWVTGSTYPQYGRTARREAERMESRGYDDSVRHITGACDVPI